MPAQRFPACQPAVLVALPPCLACRAGPHRAEGLLLAAPLCQHIHLPQGSHHHAHSAGRVQGLWKSAWIVGIKESVQNSWGRMAQELALLAINERTFSPPLQPTRLAPPAPPPAAGSRAVHQAHPRHQARPLLHRRQALRGKRTDEGWGAGRGRTRRAAIWLRRREAGTLACLDSPTMLPAHVCLLLPVAAITS